MLTFVEGIAPFTSSDIQASTDGRSFLECPKELQGSVNFCNFVPNVGVPPSYTQLLPMDNSPDGNSGYLYIPANVKRGTITTLTTSVNPFNG